MLLNTGHNLLPRLPGYLKNRLLYPLMPESMREKEKVEYNEFAWKAFNHGHGSDASY